MDGMSKPVKARFRLSKQEDDLHSERVTTSLPVEAAGESDSRGAALTVRRVERSGSCAEKKTNTFSFRTLPVASFVVVLQCIVSNLWQLSVNESYAFRGCHQNQYTDRKVFDRARDSMYRPCVPATLPRFRSSLP